MDVSLGMLIAVIGVIVTVFTGILITWQLTDKIKKSTREISKDVADKQIKEYDKLSQERFANSFKFIEQSIDNKIDSLKESIDLYIKEQRDTNISDVNSIKLLKASLIEAYKHDIRKVYYKLRETGEIDDHEKAYIDKIYPMYKALGGNSDIEAKYKAMCEVYEKCTQEAFDEARHKRNRSVKEVFDEAMGLDFKEEEDLEDE